MNLKGTLPILILSNLRSGQNHGYRIAQDIKKKSKDVLDFREGALYPALHALEKKGWIESEERRVDGRLRRYYKLTENGRKSLAKERKEWGKLSGAVSLVLEDA